MLNLSPCQVNLVTLNLIAYMCLQLQEKTMVRQRKNVLYFLTFVAYVAAGKGTPGVF